MKPLPGKTFVWARFLGKGLLFSLLLYSSAHGQAAPKIRVVTTIFPLQEFAKAVGGERAEVRRLLPPGTEAHAWEPKPGDVARISRADIFIYLGPAMEPWAHKAIKAAEVKGLTILEAGRGLPLAEAGREEEEEGPQARSRSHRNEIDLHVWLDFSLDLKIVDAVFAAFARKDPAWAGYFQKNAEDYKARLCELDRRYRESLSSCRHRRILMGGHAAFGYLARRYGLTQTALSGVSPEAEPTPRRMAGILEQIRKSGAKYIFAEEMVHPQTSRVLAGEAGVGVLLLNPGENLTAEQSKQGLTFLDLMERNLEVLRQGLECPSP